MTSVFEHFQTPAGFIQPIVKDGMAMGDDFCHHGPSRGDADSQAGGRPCFFAARQVLLLRSRGTRFRRRGSPGLAGSRTPWCAYGCTGASSGQFVDAETGQIIIGGTAAGAIAPAACALPHASWGSPGFWRLLQQWPRALYDKHVLAGLLNGGPGEALQNPDSESAFGMLESMVVLYEETGDRSWIPMAEDVARQWRLVVHELRFPFPG